MSFLRKALLTICRPLFNLLFSWEVQGRENVPANGPLILITNHVNLIDPFFLLFGFPRWIHFMAKEELFRSPFLRFWLRFAGAIPISRNGRVTEKQKTLKSALEALEAGLVLGMFPEGGRSHNGRLQKGKPGSAVIASKTNVPIVPVGIIGTEKFNGSSWLWRRPHVVVRIGKPFRLVPMNDKMSRSQMQMLTTQLMKEIAALLPPEYQGVYAKREDPES